MEWQCLPHREGRDLPSFTQGMTIPGSHFSALPPLTYHRMDHPQPLGPLGNVLAVDS